MQTKRNLIFLAVFLAVLAMSTSMAAAQTYLGQFCWGYTQDVPPGLSIVQTTLPLKAGVTHLGGAYYLVQGRIDRPDLAGDPPPDFLQATGVIVGDEVWVNGSTTEDLSLPAPAESARVSGIIQMRLSLSTLSGTFWRIQTAIVLPDGLFNEWYTTGTMMFNGACP